MMRKFSWIGLGTLPLFLMNCMSDGRNPVDRATPDGDITTTSAGWMQHYICQEECGPLLGKDIGVGANGGAWVIGTLPFGDAFEIWRANLNATWSQMPGWGHGIDVDPFGNAWVIGGYGLWKWSGSSWVEKRSAEWITKPVDIGVGANGSVWAISDVEHPLGGGFKIYRYKGDSYAWETAWEDMNGGGIRLSVDSQGRAWVVNNVNDIWRWTGSSWVKLPGKATDIGCGGGNVFILTTTPSAGGYSIKKWTGSNWGNFSGGGVSIDVGPDGNPWITSSNGTVWRYHP